MEASQRAHLLFATEKRSRAMLYITSKRETPATMTHLFRRGYTWRTQYICLRGRETLKQIDRRRPPNKILRFHDVLRPACPLCMQRSRGRQDGHLHKKQKNEYHFRNTQTSDVKPTPTKTPNPKPAAVSQWSPRPPPKL